MAPLAANKQPSNSFSQKASRPAFSHGKTLSTPNFPYLIHHQPVTRGVLVMPIPLSLKQRAKKVSPRDQNPGVSFLPSTNSFRKTNLPVTPLNGRIYKNKIA
jgi:hypothetical protein